MLIARPAVCAKRYPRELATKVATFESSPRYHRGNPHRISSFFMVAGGRTCVLNYIYNPSKPPFDKGGLWQGIACIILRLHASYPVKQKKRPKRALLLFDCGMISSSCRSAEPIHSRGSAPATSSSSCRPTESSTTSSWSACGSSGSSRIPSDAS